MENMGNDSLLVKSRKLESGGHPIFDWNEFILGDQGILTSDFFENEIAAKVKQEIANGRFLILNEDSINAYAYTEDGSNVVAITKGSLYCCLYMANFFMLKDDFFPDIGNPDACYPNASPSLFPITVDRDGNTVFPVSGDDERRNIGYVITVLALKYMVYHEVGHHKLGHLKQDKELYGLEVGEANALRKDAISSDHHNEKKH